MVEIKDLLGISYKQHGRDKQGFDCYGLVIFLYKRLGRVLPDFWYEKMSNPAFEEVGEKSVNSVVEMFEETDFPEYSDLIMFFDKKGRSLHIGMYLSKGMFIHCDVKGVQVSKLNGFYFKNRRFYKWLQQK